MGYDFQEIQARFIKIKENIEKTMKKVGRTIPPTIIAVTKTHGPELLQIVKMLGIRDVGENYVQEMIKKMEGNENFRWHFIGHLQRNKAKYIVGKVEIIHGVDSIKLVEEIDKRAMAKGVVQNIMLQVNHGEETKGGIKKEELPRFVEEINRFSFVNLVGLMALPPYFDEPEKSRPYFREIRELLDFINKKRLYKKPLTELSMGMSSDYMVAVEEGATYLRIGTALFGIRKK
jgi:pyridoxal phosphate enzyme (YggS family)